MAFASGGYHGLYYIPEATFGVTPDSPVWVPFRHTSCNFQLKRDQFESKELRADRAIADLRLGTYKCEGDVGIELSYGAFDTPLEALMGGTWAVAYALTAQSIGVTATTKKFTRATGSFITDGIQVGDWITTTGFVTAGNNGTFLVSAVAALEVTCATATGLVDEVAGGNETMTTSRFKLNQGIVQRSFSILRRFSDITQYQCFTGCCPNKLSLDFKPNGMVTGSVGFIGANMTAALPASSTYAAASANPPMDSFSATVFEGGSAFALASAITLTLENGLEADYVLGSKYAPQISWGRSKLTGKLTAFFEDLVLYNKFLNETASSLKFTTGDGTKNFVWYMDNVKYTTGDNPASDEKPIKVDMGFAALHDTVYTNLQIDRNPGA